MDASTRLLASYAANLSYSDLTPAAIHQTKRRIIDSLACAMAAFDEDTSVMVRRMARSRQSTTPASVLGDGTRTTPEFAAFVNGVMTRFLDWNDTIFSVGSGHPSDLLGAALAVAESHGRTGRDVILGTVVGYEMFAALADQVNLRERGWDQGLYIALGAAASAGRLMRLSVEQLGNALAIAVTANVPTRQTRAGELSMWKGCAGPLAASAGVLAALLAAEGITGPTEAFDGRHGIFQQVTGPLLLGPLGGQDGRPFTVEQSHLKFFPSEGHSQAPVEMALALRGRVSVDEIDQLNVETYWMTYSEIGSEPAKWDPRTRETADHSLPYLLAVALQDGAVTTESFRPERILDPALRPLMQRITVRENPDFTRQFPDALPTRIEVVTRSGQRLIEQSSYPKGHARNPMTDLDVEAKFRAACSRRLGDDRCQVALNLLWQLDTLGDLGVLFQAFATD